MHADASSLSSSCPPSKNPPLFLLLLLLPRLRPHRYPNRRTIPTAHTAGRRATAVRWSIPMFTLIPIPTRIVMATAVPQVQVKFQSRHQVRFRRRVKSQLQHRPYKCQVPVFVASQARPPSLFLPIKIKTKIKTNTYPGLSPLRTPSTTIPRSCPDPIPLLLRPLTLVILLPLRLLMHAILLPLRPLTLVIAPRRSPARSAIRSRVRVRVRSCRLRVQLRMRRLRVWVSVWG